MELSPKTIRNYSCIVSRLILNDKTLTDIKEIKRQVQEKTKNIGTQKNYYSAILWHIKNNSLDTPINDEITNEIMKIRNTEEKEREKNKITEKQKYVFMKWNEIIKLRDKLEKQPVDPFYIFLCLFTYQPVRRLEDTTLYYFKRKPPTNDKNYIILNKRLGYVVYNVYKTSRNYGKQRYKLPQTLFNIVKKYIKEANITEGTPLFGYTLSNSFGRYLSSRFEKETGKAMTINTLRHSFITHLSEKKLSLGTKKNIARKMGHTFNEQAKYSYHMDV